MDPRIKSGQTARRVCGAERGVQEMFERIEYLSFALNQ